MHDLDPATLRVALGTVLGTTLLLFYGVTYRRTRAPYVALWCLALLGVAAGTSLYLFNGTDAQRWSNPLANVVVVVGMGCAWAAARSLQGRRTPWWWLAAAPAVVLAFAWGDSPATNTWPGGEAYLLAVACLILLCAATMWNGSAVETGRLQRSVAVAAGVVGLFYLVRLSFFVELGPDDPFFVDYLGASATTLIITVLLVSVTFSMAALSNEQQTRELHRRASRDGLTGLLNRSEFLRLAELELRHLERTGRPGAVVLADVDHFKQVNDRFGHDAGDRVLQEFATSSLDALRSTDLVGRYGGEEFVFLLPGASTGEAERVMMDVRRRMRPADHTVPRTTASFGIAALVPGGDLAETIAAADRALYSAKAGGRDRVEHARGCPGHD